MPLVELLLPVDEPDVPVVDEPAPDDLGDDVELRLESGEADGEPPSLRVHAVVPNASASAKNIERALVISHLLPHSPATVMPRAVAATGRALGNPTQTVAGTADAGRCDDV